MYLGERLSVRRARQLGLSYNLAGREDDPDNYKSNAGKLPGGIDIRNVVTTKARKGGEWSTRACMDGVQS